MLGSRSEQGTSGGPAQGGQGEGSEGQELQVLLEKSGAASLSILLS